MRKIIKYLTVIVLSNLIISGLVIVGIGYVGCWLQVKHKPVHSDAIIILAGGSLRAFYAADLFLEGYAPKVYISKAIHSRSSEMLKELEIYIPNEEEIYRQVLQKKGVPDEAIFTFGDSSLSTVEEAEAIKLTLGGQNKRLLVVTSPTHVRRSQMIFDDILLKSETIVIGTPYGFHSNKWWENKHLAVNVFLETVKILFYEFGFRFYSKKVVVQ